MSVYCIILMCVRGLSGIRISQHFYKCPLLHLNPLIKYCNDNNVNF